MVHAEAMDKDLVKDKYFEVATLKLVADIRKHVTSTKVELPTSLQEVVRVLNNYCTSSQSETGWKHMRQSWNRVSQGC